MLKSSRDIYFVLISSPLRETFRPENEYWIYSTEVQESTRNPYGTNTSGVGTRGDGVPPLFDREGRVPHSPTFWTEIRAKVSLLLQLVTY